MKVLTKNALTLGVVAVALSIANIAGSHASEKMDPPVQARHSQMQMIGYHTGLLGAVAKGEIEFDAATVAGAAANIKALAELNQATMWTAGTEQGTAVGSRAKTEIWSDPEGFAARFDAMAEAASALMDASDVDAVRAGMSALGGSCKACHEKYRGPKN